MGCGLARCGTRATDTYGSRTVGRVYGARRAAGQYTYFVEVPKREIPKREGCCREADAEGRGWK
eukprot:354007-Chlamydomonas_euryale.AAC.2